MRIYYFGELVEDTNETKKAEMGQTKLELNEVPQEKSGIQSIGEILQELDLNLDSFRPAGSRHTHA